jgi:hypothetical protein
LLTGTSGTVLKAPIPLWKVPSGVAPLVSTKVMMPSSVIACSGAGSGIEPVLGVSAAGHATRKNVRSAKVVGSVRFMESAFWGFA